MDDHPAVFTDEEEAVEDAKNRLLVWRVASQIRLDRGVPSGELVRVRLRDVGGSVLFDGDVQWPGAPAPGAYAREAQPRGRSRC